MCCAELCCVVLTGSMAVKCTLYTNSCNIDDASESYIHSLTQLGGASPYLPSHGRNSALLKPAVKNLTDLCSKVDDFGYRNSICGVKILTKILTDINKSFFYKTAICG